MGFDRGRVVQIWSPALPGHGSVDGLIGGRNGAGSGYRISAELVLTAAHAVAGHPVHDVTDEAPEDPKLLAIKVAVFGAADWVPAVVVWRDEDTDVAVLRAGRLPKLPVGSPNPRWGVVTGDKPVECMAVGFPWAAVTPHQLRDTEHMIGFIPPLSEAVTGTQAITVRSSPPLPRDDKGSPWAGMSGAGLFCGRYLVGVIVVDPTRYGTDRLRATPLASLLERDKGLGRLLGAEAGAQPVWTPPPLAISAQDSMSLRPPYRPLRGSAPSRSPGVLLQAQHGMVPFSGRTDQLVDLQDWCRQEEPLALRVVTGDGGAGKTRLAAELCAVMATQGWDTGFAEFNPPGKDQVDDYDRATLVVVDDADQQVNLLEKLLTTLDYRPYGAVPVRVLLLARNLQGWWAQLNVQTERLPEEITDPVLQLTDGELGPEERAHQYHAAYSVWEQFRVSPTALGPGSARSAEADLQTSDTPEDPGPPEAEREAAKAPELSDSAFANPLLVHMTALLEVFPEPRPGPHTSSVEPGGNRSREERGTYRGAIERQKVREKILARVLSHEEARWQKIPGRPANPDGTPNALTARQMVTVATLTAPSTRETAEQHLTAVPRLEKVNALDRAQLGDWLRQLYPGPDPPWVVPLRPDLLAEELLAATDQLTEVTDSILTQLFITGDTAAISQLLGELVRAGQRLPVCQALDHLLDAYLPRLLDYAVEDLTGQIATQLDRALQIAKQPAQAAVQVYRLPERSIILAPLTLTLTQQMVDYLRDQADADPETFISDLAGSLNNLSNAWTALGQGEQALEAITEAVKIFQELANTDLEAFAPDLARSMGNLSNALGNSGQRDQALETISTAVEMLRKLADADPEAFVPDLARSMGTYSNALGEVGQREQALEAIDECVDLYLKLAASNPEAFTPNLASSLNNLSVHLGALGKQEQAREAIEKAVGLYLMLAGSDPEAFTPELASSWNTLSITLAELGQQEQSLEAIEKSLKLYRKLSEAHPKAFNAKLAGCLNNLSVRLGDLGQHEAALEAVTEALSLRQDLAATHPIAFNADLASSWNNLSIRLAALNQHVQALEASLEAIRIYRELAAAHPKAFAPDLARSWNNLSNILAELGDREQALGAITEAVKLRQELAANQPETFTSDLAQSWNNLSIILAELHQHEQALAATSEGVRLYRELAATQPEAFTPDLARSLNTLSNRLLDTGDLNQALKAITEAIKLIQELATNYPEAFMPELAGFWINQSVTLAELNQHERALKPITEGVKLYRGLAAVQPEIFAPSLARGLITMGSHLTKVGRFQEALDADYEAVELYLQVIEVEERFLTSAAKAVSNLVIDFRDLEYTKYEISQKLRALFINTTPQYAFNLGLLLTEDGCEFEAQAVIRTAIDTGLLSQDPKTANNLGAFLARQGDMVGAREAYQSAIDSGHPDAAPYAAMNLGLLLARQGDMVGACEAYQSAIDSGHPDAGPAAAGNLGLLMASQGDEVEAQVAFQNAINSGHPDWAPLAEVELGKLLGKN